MKEGDDKSKCLNTNKIQIEYGEKEMSVCKAFEIDEVGIKELGKQRGNKGVKSVNDAVALLQKEGRRHLLNEAFGIDAKRVTPFSENDRGEDRS